MCQGCEDMAEYCRVVDEYLMEELRSMLVPESDETLRILRGESA